MSLERVKVGDCSKCSRSVYNASNKCPLCDQLFCERCFDAKYHVCRGCLEDIPVEPRFGNSEMEIYPKELDENTSLFQRYPFCCEFIVFAIGLLLGLFILFL